jgi:hypothetical protein
VDGLGLCGGGGLEASAKCRCTVTRGHWRARPAAADLPPTALTDRRDVRNMTAGRGGGNWCESLPNWKSVVFLRAEGDRITFFPKASRKLAHWAEPGY